MEAVTIIAAPAYALAEGISANAKRVARHAEKKRAAGRKRISLWVSDTDAEIIFDFAKRPTGTDARAALTALATLTGSTAQLGWAAEIRTGKMAQLINYLLPLPGMHTRAGERNAVLTKALGYLPTELERFELANMLRLESSAHWWIENRHCDAFMLLRKAGQRGQHPRFQPDPINNEEADRAIATATLRPDTINGTVAEVALQANTVAVTFAEFDEKANSVVKKYNFGWHAPRWERVFDTTNQASERAVEVAVQLLASGFPVRLFDDALRAQVIGGEYEPESTRHITVSRSEKFGTKFCVTWKRDAQYHECARLVHKIQGAREFKTGGGAFVQMSRWEELQDLIELSGFVADADTVSELAKQQAKRDKMLGVTPRVKRAASLPVITKPLANGAIDASLADN